MNQRINQRMGQRVKISALGTAGFVCPECSRKKTLQLSGYNLSKRYTRVKYNCPCGNRVATVIEKAPGQWKDIHLAGFFTIRGKKGNSLNTGQMMVKRITSQGLTMRLSKEIKIAAGTPLEVEFVLDDAMQSIVTKNVHAIAQNGQFLTALFDSKEHLDNLGPYLYFNKLNK